MKRVRKDRKFNKSKEWLYEEYVIKNRSRSELAAECGLTLAGFKSVLVKYDIKKEEFHVDPNEVARLLDDGKSVEDIMRVFDCGKTTIYRIMKKNNLHINYKPVYKEYDDSRDELMCSLYMDGFSTTQIAKAMNLTHGSVLNHLNRCGVKVRSFVESQFNYRGKDVPKELYSYEDMYELYIVQKKNRNELGNMFGISPDAILTALKKLGIPVRNNSESKIGTRTGSQHHNWKGGITPLSLRVREFLQLHVNPVVLKRDNYTCQMCGDRGGKLHVHHIRPFKDIFWEIIHEHPELDITNNQEDFYNIVVNDDRLLDLDNLITYCASCHLNID